MGCDTKVMRNRSPLYRDDLPTIKETIRIYFTSTSEVCRNKREKQLVDPVEKKLMNRLQSNLTVTLLTFKSFANFFALFFSSFYRLTFVLRIMTFLMLYMLLEGWQFYPPRAPPPFMIRFFLIIFPTCLSFHVPRYFFAPLVPLG